MPTKAQAKTHDQATQPFPDALSIPADFNATAERVFRDFNGTADVYERAIGALALGHLLGWRPLFLMHTYGTLKKYERILGVTFRDVCPEEGPYAHRARCYHALKSIKNYWKTVTSQENKGARSEYIDGPDQRELAL